jgi:hypothetical protein
MPSLTTASSTTGTTTPASNAAVAGRGDNNGFQTSVGGGSLAEADGKGLLDIDSGTGVATDGCGTTPQNEADYHEFSNFDFSIPSGAWISGIEVELTASSTASGTNLLCAALSWNGGTSTTTAKSSGDLPFATTTIKLGGPTDTWGRGWSTSGTNELSNSKFRLYLMPDSDTAATADYWLDKVIARVYYTATTTKANIAVDGSGQGNKGTLTNGPTRTIGKIGQALQFDGSNDQVLIGSDVLGASALTISVWIYTANNNSYIITNSNGNTALILENGTTNLLFACLATNTRSASNSVSTNVWMHVVVTRDAGNLVNFYVNGIRSGTANQDCGTPVAGATQTSIGSTVGGSSPYNGKMDDVRVYNRVLSAQEITRLYNMGRMNP